MRRAPGGPVELVVYDDQIRPSQAAAIYEADHQRQGRPAPCRLGFARPARDGGRAGALQVSDGRQLAASTAIRSLKAEEHLVPDLGHPGSLGAELAKVMRAQRA